jgi:hypothetical protein
MFKGNAFQRERLRVFVHRMVKPRNLRLTHLPPGITQPQSAINTPESVNLLRTVVNWQYEISCAWSSFSSQTESEALSKLNK